MATKGFSFTEILIVVLIIGLLVAIAIPGYNRMRQRSQAELCAANLKMIEQAKARWALDTNADESAEPTEEDLAEYINGTFPQPVVAGAEYSIGNLVTPVACSVHSSSE